MFYRSRGGSVTRLFCLTSPGVITNLINDWAVFDSVSRWILRNHVVTMTWESSDSPELGACLSFGLRQTIFDRYFLPLLNPFTPERKHCIQTPHLFSQFIDPHQKHASQFFCTRPVSSKSAVKYCKSILLLDGVGIKERCKALHLLANVNCDVYARKVLRSADDASKEQWRKLSLRHVYRCFRQSLKEW